MNQPFLKMIHTKHILLNFSANLKKKNIKHQGPPIGPFLEFIMIIIHPKSINIIGIAFCCVKPKISWIFVVLQSLDISFERKKSLNLNETKAISTEIQQSKDTVFSLLEVGI